MAMSLRSEASATPMFAAAATSITAIELFSTAVSDGRDGGWWMLDSGLWIRGGASWLQESGGIWTWTPASFQLALSSPRREPPAQVTSRLLFPTPRHAIRLRFYLRNEHAP